MQNAGWLLPLVSLAMLAAPRLISTLAVCLAKRRVVTTSDVTSHVVHEVTNAVEEALDMQSTTLVPVGFNGASEHTAYAATGLPRWVVLVFGYVVARIVN